jgi:hypothetical protein
MRQARLANKAATAAAASHLNCLNGGDCDGAELSLVEEEEARAERAWRAYEQSCTNRRETRP